MDNTEVLKRIREVLLKLHKSLVDQSREEYEAENGPATATEFLAVLIENKDYDWLRRFSALIVDTDELFARRDGFEKEEVTALLDKIKEIANLKSPDAVFKDAFNKALATNFDAGKFRKEIVKLLKPSKATKEKTTKRTKAAKK